MEALFHPIIYLRVSGVSCKITLFNSFLYSFYLMTRDVYERSLDYHRYPKPGKLEIKATKPLADQNDLALAYSPGVAAASRLIADHPEEAANMTSRGNLIAVVSNGTAVLGLGDIGALASKPVMEGKAVLFKKFAGIDVFDIEINEQDPDKLVDIIAALEPTFGGINLEDIKAPECFYIEEKLRNRMRIPVFHDDQHGTAIIVAAAIVNGLKLHKKKLEDVTIVTSGAGAAAIACLNLLVSMGLQKSNVIVCDRTGVVHTGRTFDAGDPKSLYACHTEKRTLEDAIQDADIFLGLSVGGVVTQNMIQSMAKDPLVLALANPEPEILPNLAREVRPDAIIATGRSDFPNQVNNVLCFPFIFRGALDVGATTINEAMKIACVHAIANLAQAEAHESVTRAYGGEIHQFGPEYIIPKPFDPRLIVEIAPVVAKAAMDSGIATRPIDDLDAYRDQLKQYVNRSSMVMRPVIQAARSASKRIVLSEGEEERVLRAAQDIVDENIARPILIGRPSVIATRIERFGLRIQAERDFDLIDPGCDDRFPQYWHAYHTLLARRGISPDLAKTVVRTNPTIIGALALQLGDADGMICGTVGRYQEHLRLLKQILGQAPSITQSTGVLATLSLMILERGNLFIADPYVNYDPTPEELVDITLMAAEQVKRFGITPKIALLSHSNFGTSRLPSAKKMAKTRSLLMERAPDLNVEGEMHADIALRPDLRFRLFPENVLQGEANLLIMPNLDAANIVFNLLKVVGEGLTVGPMMMGLSKPVHIATHSATSRGIVDLAALAAAEA